MKPFSSAFTPFALAALLLGCSLPSAHAATFNVTKTADSGAGTLRQAILDANASPGADTITFAERSGPQVIDLTTVGDGAGKTNFSAFLVSGDLTIAGPGANRLTVQRKLGEGVENFRIFKIAAGAAVTIRGLTISNGKNSIAVSDSGYSVTNYPGGGISNAGTLTLEDCVLSGNTATTAGPQSAGGLGGAVYSTGALTVRGCTFLNNRGRRGGAINGQADISNSTFAGNKADEPATSLHSRGGALLTLGTSSITNCTFVNNLAGAVGAAVFNEGNLTVSNTIFTYYSVESSGTFIDGGYNLTYDNGHGLFTSATSKINTYPALDELFYGNGGSTPTFGLRASSPAIDAGDSPLDTDQRGQARPSGTADDIGAFERQQIDRPIIFDVDLVPYPPYTDDPLIAHAKAEDSGGSPSTFTWKWQRTRNGKTVTLPETSSNLNTEGDIVVVGDIITLTVVANNGFYDSAPHSVSVTVQNTRISITSFTLQPKSPYTSEKLVATVKTADADKTRPFYSYEWYCNDNLVRTVTNSRNSQDVLDLNQKGFGDKGDRIGVTVTVSDGAWASRETAFAGVRNSVPVLTQLALSPQSPTARQVLTSTYAGRDADGDALTKIYKWKIGTKVLTEEKGSRLDLAKYPGVKAGDVITLEMRLSDGESLSKTLQAQVTVAASATAASTAAS